MSATAARGVFPSGFLYSRRIRGNPVLLTSTLLFRTKKLMFCCYKGKTIKTDTARFENENN